MGKTLPQLTETTTVEDTDELLVNDGGSPRRVSVTNVFKGRAILPSYATKTALEGATIPAEINRVMLRGYAAENDGGGAEYKRVGSEPSHAGKAQSADGAWWELVMSSEGVDIRALGAKINGTDDDLTAFNNAMGFLDAKSGGALRIPPGVLLTSDELVVDKDDIHIVGAGIGATEVRLSPTTGLVNVFTFVETPLVNGVTKVYRGSISNLTINGNFTGTATTSTVGCGIVAAGLSRFTFRDLLITNCGQYGIGLQNGGYDGVLIENVWIDNVGLDGIDIKDNGSVSKAITIRNVEVRNWGKRDDVVAPSAGVDIMSLAPIVDELRVIDFGAVGTPGTGLRIKQGIVSSDRGYGGEYATIGQVYVEQTDGTATDVQGVSVKAPYVHIGSVVVRGATGVGVNIEQERCVINSMHVEGCGIGLQFGGATAPSEQPTSGADYCSVGILHVVDCTTAISHNRVANSIGQAFITGCTTGVDEGSSGTRTPLCIGFISFADTTTEWDLTQNLQLLGTRGVDGPALWARKPSGVGEPRETYLGGQTAVCLVTGYAGDPAATLSGVRVVGASTNVQFTAEGTGTDMDVILAPKGAGLVRFGTHAAVTTETVTGFITIKDGAGNSRKIAVVS